MGLFLPVKICIFQVSGGSMSEKKTINDAVSKRYEHGFISDVAADTFEPGLNEDIIRRLSAIKQEPSFMLNWRLKAYKKWCMMDEPNWAALNIEPIDYQAISYYSAPKTQKDGPKSLDEVDPELLRTYDRLGIPLYEQKMLAGVAVDAVFDSVSIATTFKDKLKEAGVILSLIHI